MNLKLHPSAGHKNKVVRCDIVFASGIQFEKITNLNRHHLYVPTVTAHSFAPLAMPPKRSKNSPSVQDPNCLSTCPRNAVTHPGNIVQSQCSTRRPESVIQTEKAEKAAKRAKKEQQKI